MEYKDLPTLAILRVLSLKCFTVIQDSLVRVNRQLLLGLYQLLSSSVFKTKFQMVNKCKLR